MARAKVSLTVKRRTGRRKGSEYELDIAKLIVATFNLERADCYRTPRSGGHRYACKTDPGDLVMSPRLKKLFPWGVECKFWAALEWDVLLERGMTGKPWRDWWAQACAASSKPLLVFRQNHGQSHCMFRVRDFPTKTALLTLRGSCGTYLRTVDAEGYGVMLCSFNSFLEVWRDHCTKSPK